MPMEIVYGALALVLGWWAIRLARSRGSRAPLIWGGLVFVLSLLPRPWNLLGIAPLFLLLFIRPGVYRPPAPPREMACPRCRASHSASQRYCISCGWELERAYPDAQQAESPGQVDPSAEAGATASAGPAEAPAASPAATSAASEETVVAAAEPEAAPQVGPAEVPAEAPEPVLASQEAQALPADTPVTEATQAGQQEAVEPEEEAVTAPVFRGQPTAPNMTERGIRLFNQGRVQEAIDQFTKAIALDANYKEAWERRAEAYSKLGRSEQAAEDRRRLQAINASSTST